MNSVSSCPGLSQLRLGQQSDADFLDLLKSMRRAATEGEPIACYGESPVDADRLEHVVRLLVPLKPCVIPPRVDPAFSPHALKPMPAGSGYKPKQYVWRWAPIPISWAEAEAEGALAHGSFPLPVALTEDATDGYKHWLSVSALWHLLPTTTKLHRHLAPSSPIWAWLAERPVPQTHHLPSIKSLLSRQRKTHAVGPQAPEPAEADEAPLPIRGATSDLQFSMHMGSPLLVFGYLAYQLKGVTLPGEAQAKILELLDAIVRRVQLPLLLKLPGRQVLAFTAHQGAKAPGTFVLDRLQELGSAAKWTKASVPLSSLTRPVPLAHFVWFCFRNCEMSDAMAKACTMVLHQVAQAWERTMTERPNRLMDTLEGVVVPPGCNSVVLGFKAALRGQDKDYVNGFAFLKHSHGFFRPSDLTLGDLCHDAPRQYAARLLANVVCSYYVAAAGQLRDKVSTSNEHCFGTHIAFDASRAFKQEVLHSIIAVHGLVVSGPPQILPDLDQLLEDPKTVQEKLADVILGKKGKTTVVRYHASKTYFTALVNTLLQLMPFADFSQWHAGEAILAGPKAKRTVVQDAPAPAPGLAEPAPPGGHVFVWDRAAGSSDWCLPLCLRTPAAPRSCHVLSLVGDEGSIGWRVYQFLAGPGNLRVIWHSDPAHRLTNAYLNAMRSVPPAFKVIQQVLMVHKYRRAPFGGGKFWRQAQGAIAVLTNGGTHGLGIFDMFARSIAADLGIEPDVLEREPHRLMEAMDEGIGAKVEMRRWWTHYDASGPLLRIWHTLLVAILMQDVQAGVNPFKPQAPSAARGEGAVGQQEPVAEGSAKVPLRGEKFNFREVAKKVLWNSLTLRLLKSSLLIFRRLRTHFAGYIRASLDPKACLGFLQTWSSPSRWHAQVVTPSLQQSLPDTEELASVGLVDNLGPFVAPVLDQLPDMPDVHELLVVHVRQVASLAFHLELYAAMYQSPPWSLCRLLDLSGPELASFLQDLKALWELVLSMERSEDPKERSDINSLPMTRWAVFREPLLLLEANAWTAPGPLVLSYVRTLFSGILNTMSNENGFNDLRDAERRQAKHHTRAPEAIAAVAIKSQVKRFPDEVNVQVSPKGFTRCASWHAGPTMHVPKPSPQQCSPLPTERILKSDWPSTSAHLFSLSHCMMLQALSISPREAWRNLWLARIFRPYLVISDAATKAFFYTVGISHHLVLAIPLTTTTDGLLTFKLDDEVCVARLPVATVDQYACHPHSFVFKGGQRDPIRIDTRKELHLLDFMLLNYVHVLPAGVIRRLAASLKIDCQSTATIPLVVELLFRHRKLSGEAADDMIRRVQELHARRLRAKADTDEAAQQGEHDPEAEEEQPEHEVAQALADLAPHEYNFLQGHLPGGRALNEEESDGANEEEEDGDAGLADGAQGEAPQPQAAASSAAGLQGFPRLSARDYEAPTPAGCTLKLVQGGAAQGPQWVGTLPLWAPPYEEKRSAARSYQSGIFRGCGRTSDEARLEVLHWLQAAMAGKTPPAAPPAEAASSSNRGAKRTKRR